MEAAVKKVWIPQISDEHLSELASRIKPVVRFNGDLHHIKPVDLRRESFLWAPMSDGRSDKLTELCDIKTYHTYGAPVFFKPSVAEVIAAIPPEHLEKVVAFEVLDTTDPMSDHEAVNAGYHIATTRLYVSA